MGDHCVGGVCCRDRIDSLGFVENEHSGLGKKLYGRHLPVLGQQYFYSGENGA